MHLQIGTLQWRRKESEEGGLDGERYHRHNNCYTFHIVQGAIKLSQVLTPFCLSWIEMRLLEEVDKRVVVGVHIHMGVVEVAPPHDVCMHNGKHLAIMDQVVHLCRVERRTEVFRALHLCPST